jgi:MFS family permease
MTAIAERATHHEHRPRTAMLGTVLTFTMFMPVLALVVLSPAVPAMLGHFNNVAYATTVIPLLVTLPGLALVIFSPIAGYIVDGVGRRLPLILATACYGIAGCAPLFASSLLAIAISRFCVGICEAFILVAMNALLADYFDMATRRFWLTLQSAVLPIGAALAAITAGVLTEKLWNGAFLIYSFAFLICLLQIRFCHEPTRHAEATTADAADGRFPARSVAIICGASFLSCIIFAVGLVQIGLAYQAVGLTSSATLGTYVGLSTLGVMCGAGVFLFTARSQPGEMVLAVCMLLFGIGLIVVGLAAQPGTVFLGSFIHQVGAAMVISSVTLWISRTVSVHHRGRAFGFLNAASSGGQFASPLVVGLVRESLGGILPTFLILGVVTLAGAAILMLMARSPLPGAEPAVPLP